MGEQHRTRWEKHWQALHGPGSVFGLMVRIVRVLILNRAVRRYAERFFPESGCFAELGCGTGQASTLILRRSRTLIGVDFSGQALVLARSSGAFSWHLQGDIRSLPFAESSLDGAWNLGVMEHFETHDGFEILREIHRVLKPGAHVILFWPPKLGSSRLVLGPIEFLRSALTGRQFNFFPDEVNRSRSTKHGGDTLLASGFEVVRSDRTWRDAFIHIVLVGRKP